VNKTIVAVGVSALLLPFSPAAPADEGRLSIGSGFNYSSGEYGTTATTRIRSIPLDLGYDAGAWRLNLTIPYLDVSGPPNVIPGVGAVRNTNLRTRIGSLGLPIGGPGTTATTAATLTSGSARGLGDVIALASFNVYGDAAAQFGIDVAGRIKFGTADADKGLGTGENDYGAEVDMYRKFDRVTLFGGAGYTKMGASQYIKLNNVFNANTGVSLKFDDANLAGVLFDYHQRASDIGEARREATVFYNHVYAKTWKTQLYVLKGFTDGGPNWGAGVTLTYSF